MTAWKSIFVIITLNLINPVLVLAGDENDHDKARELSEAGKILPLETILEKVKEEKRGRVLEVELEDKHGRYYYSIELLDINGKVWEEEYDAMSGKLLKRKQEHD
ncbi:MAG: PepSY domain-containing protein [Gammaproteobacteria bacterium]|nr:PepSY domain-containing protein [Gammaproteobacteria bacterium]